VLNDPVNAVDPSGFTDQATGECCNESKDTDQIGGFLSSVSTGSAASYGMYRAEKASNASHLIGEAGTLNPGGLGWLFRAGALAGLLDFVLQVAADWALCLTPSQRLIRAVVAAVIAALSAMLLGAVAALLLGPGLSLGSALFVFGGSMFLNAWVIPHLKNWWYERFNLDQHETDCDCTTKEGR
jgi:hypothetical protein